MPGLNWRGSKRTGGPIFHTCICYEACAASAWPCCYWCWAGRGWLPSRPRYPAYCCPYPHRARAGRQPHRGS
ncbi:MAG: hypothetical protein WKG07_14185 [Hymenobacter sp.]